MTFDEFIQFAIFTVSGFVIGILIQKLLTPQLHRFAQKSKWAGDDLIILVISKWIIPWFTVLGIYLGWKRVEMDEKYHRWLENGITIFYILSATIILSKVLSGLTAIRDARSGKISSSSSIIGNIVKVIVYCLGLLMILQSVGIKITPILTALGVGGLAVALALQDTLSNLFAGIQIVSTKKINTGDYIKLDSGQEGFVEDVNWRYTSVRVGANSIFIVPNSKMASLIVTNFDYPNREFVFDIPVGVDYNSNLDHVERVTIEVIKELQETMEECVPDFDPLIRFQQFGASSIDLKAFIRVRDFSSQFIVKHEFIKRLKKRYEEEGINIPYPVQTVFINTPAEENKKQPDQ
ncbi:mechanosensitive ion channel protein [Terrimonas sp.]|uniref:mechanosensitive ion channel family protein n=1 Tax=Terrimonas sp. TaxID=1914338 RepID=UPI000D518776|nr:mechanosensitive ion channel family protein [Terrimonas sp.]PVD52729.1 mechanosensitive ion channel protein [Terrimonas sp.]